MVASGSVDELLQTEGTVILHISFALKQNQVWGRGWSAYCGNALLTVAVSVAVGTWQRVYQKHEGVLSYLMLLK